MKKWVLVMVVALCVAPAAVFAQEETSEKKSLVERFLNKASEKAPEVSQAALEQIEGSLEKTGSAEPTSPNSATDVAQKSDLVAAKATKMETEEIEQSGGTFQRITSYVRFPSIGFWVCLAIGLVLLGISSNFDVEVTGETKNTEMSFTVAAGIALGILVISNAGAIWSGITAMNLVYGIVYLVGGVVLWSAVGAFNMWVRWRDFTRRIAQEITVAVQQFLTEKAVQNGTAPSPRITNDDEKDEFYEYARRNRLAYELPQLMHFKWKIGKWVYTAPVGLPVFFLANGGKWLSEIVVDAFGSRLQAITDHYKKNLPIDLHNKQ